MATKWNEDQLAAIESVDENTLVSASAGSGKTAVTIERIIRIIKNGTPVRRVVMLAFSNAVAAELKDRISSELVKAIREDGADKEYLREQIDDVSMADVCTVHSFCGNLVKEFFEEAGIDPSYSILEPAERDGMLDKAVDTVLKRYGEEADPLVSSLKFTFGSDSEFRNQIKRVYGFLEAQPDRKAWLNEACKGYGIDDPAADEFIGNSRIAVSELGAAADELFAKMSQYPSFDGENRVKIYLTAQACKQAADTVGKSFVDALAKVDLSFKAGRKSAKAAVAKAAREMGLDETAASVIYEEIRQDEKEFADLCERTSDKVGALAAYPLSDWEKYGKQAVPYAEKLAEIVAKVEAEYGEQKQSENKMDFADLEYYAIKVLKNDRIAEEVASRYDYVCIDEYQDTNYVQEFVLKRISNGRNLFMVGDVKQSIYQFRLTETEIFLDKYDGYSKDPSKGKTVTLNKNYRSDRRILDFVNDVFSRLMTKENGGIDYAGTAMLETDIDPLPADDGQAVRICPIKKEKKKSSSAYGEDGVYSVEGDVPEEEDASLEARCIAEKIAAIVGKKDIPYYENGERKTRKVRYGDITLLCATRSARVRSIISYLRDAEIPVAGANVSGGTENVGVAMLTDLMKVIDNPMQDVPLIAVMKSVFGGFDCSELAEIRKNYPKEECFWSCTRKYADEKDDALAAKLNAFYGGIRDLREDSGQVTAAKLLEDAVAKYSFDKYVLAHFGKEDCERMRAFISSLRDKSYALTLQSVLAYGEDVSIETDVAEKPEDEDCVQTSTIHASKGLEYPVVFLIDTETPLASRPADLLLDKDLGIAMKCPEEETRLKRDTLKHAFCAQKLAKKALEEKLRLFYVALTRAKNLLFITGATGKFAEGKKKGESFINWLGNICSGDEEFRKKYVERYEPEDGQEEESDEEIPLAFLAPDPEKLREIKEYIDFEYPYEKSAETGIKHTVTGINKENPEDYGTTYVKNWFEEDSASVGTAYHKVMENVDYDSPSVEDVAAQIEDMRREGILDELSARAVSPAVVFRCLCSDIITKARACVHMREKQFMLRVSAKDVIEDAPEDKILVQGTIDLLIPDYANKTATVVDFKMSKLPAEAIAKRYRKQLELYALAAENGLGLRVDKKLIYVLGQDVILEV